MQSNYNASLSRAERRASRNRASRLQTFSRHFRNRSALTTVAIPIIAILLAFAPAMQSHAASNYTLAPGVNHYALTLGDAGGYSIVYGTGGTIDTLDATSLLSGPNGYIGDGGPTAINNEGQILSNVSGGQITLRYTNFGNTGTIAAQNGGTLYLQANVDNTNGILNVDAASAFDISSQVTGGQSTGAGALTLNSATLIGFTSNSQLTVNNATVASGLTLNNHATVYGGLHLIDSTVSGTGDVQLGTSNSNYGILYSEGSTQNTVGSAMTIHGPNGYIGDGGVLFDNKGTVASDVAGGQMTLRYTNFRNENLFKAINGGTLYLNANLDNTGGILFVDAASAIDSNSLIHGGQVTGQGTLNLNGSTIDAFTANANLSIANAGITNGLVLNNHATVYGALHITDSTLSGTGDVQLGTSNSNYGILYSNGASQNIVGSAMTIHGPNGYIGDGGVLFDNKGTIASDVLGGQMTLRYTNFRNENLFEAINGGTLNLNANLDNTGGILFVDAASAIDSNSLIHGGQVTGQGTLNLNGSTIDAFTANANLSIANATVTNGLLLNSTAHVTGTLNVNNSTISGNGDITLGSLPNYAILTSNGAGPNVIGGGIVVHGANGYIGDGGTTIDNQGTISSDVNGGQMTIRYGSLTNEGTLSAVNGGTMNVNEPITDTGKVIAGAGSTVNVVSGFTQSGSAAHTTVDGTLNVGQNGVFTVAGGKLDGVGTINGTVLNTGGIVSPVDGPGTLTVNGNYTQSAGGTLMISFDNSSHSLLQVNGTGTTGGDAVFAFLGNTPSQSLIGSSFDFLDTNTLVNGTGTNFYFANETTDIGGGNGLVTEAGPGGGIFRILQDANNPNNLEVTLLSVNPNSVSTAAPEPAQTATFGIGLLGLGALFARARKRKISQN